MTASAGADPQAIALATPAYAAPRRRPRTPCAVVSRPSRWLQGGYGRYRARSSVDSEQDEREDEEEEKGITVHTEILYADIAWSWAQDLERRRAWRIPTSARTVMAYIKIGEL